MNLTTDSTTYEPETGDGATYEPETSSGAGVPRLLVPILAAVTIVCALGAAAAYLAIGGIPADADRYGTVSAPGTKTLSLPAGEVFIDRSGAMSDDSSTAMLGDGPQGLRVKVRPAGGGAPLSVQRRSAALYTISSDGVGHEPFAKVDVPRAGRYAVDVRSPGGATTLLVGAAPWNPLGSPVLGAALAFLAVIVMFGSPLLFVRRLGARSSA